MKQFGRFILSLLSSLTSVTLTTSSDIETVGAIARFDNNNGLVGNVKIINGHIILNLTINSNNDDNDGNDFDWSSLGSHFDSEDGDDASICVEGGLYFGIYDTWSYSETNDKYGSDGCSSDNIGYRWDPWLACSSLSSNENCIINDGCVPASSSDWVSDEYEYICNEWSFETNPYICELGDLSGKYGLLTVDSSNLDSNENYIIDTSFSSAFEVDSYDLGGKSLLFRCHDNTRAFCAPFESYKPTSDELSDYTRSFQETFYYSTDDSSEIDTDTSDNIYSMRAQFGDSGSSYVLLTYYNKYEIVLDSSDIDVPGGCGDDIYYRIFVNWDETGSDCEEKTDNMFWDPTLRCDERSENSDLDNGKGYCEDEYYLCGDTEWSYECNDYLSDLTERINCAPGDLSGKYGIIDISDNVNFGIFNKSGFDTKMPPMSLLVGKSVILQCSESLAIIDCAPFSSYTDDIGYKDLSDLSVNDNDNDNDSGSSKSSNNGNSNNFMGLSNTVAILLVLLIIASIIPCVKGIQKCKSMNENNNINKKENENERETNRNRNRNRNRATANVSGSKSYHTQSGARVKKIEAKKENVEDIESGNRVNKGKNRTVPSIQQGMAM